MNQKALETLKRHFSELKVAINSFRLARNSEEAAKHWLDILSAYQKIYSKLKPACVGNPKIKQWHDRQVVLLKTDNLLSYLHQARNAEEHGLEEVTQPIFEVNLGAFGRYGSYHIKELYVDDDQNLHVDAFNQFGERVTADHVSVVNRLMLTAVTNRGVTYLPPTSHKGSHIEPTNVLEICRLIENHIEQLLEEASQFLV